MAVTAADINLNDLRKPSFWTLEIFRKDAKTYLWWDLFSPESIMPRRFQTKNLKKCKLALLYHPGNMENKMKMINEFFRAQFCACKIKRVKNLILELNRKCLVGMKPWSSIHKWNSVKLVASRMYICIPTNYGFFWHFGEGNKILKWKVSKHDLCL